MLSHLVHWKRLWCWEGLGAGGEGDDSGWNDWMASPIQRMWVCMNSGSWWWTGGLECCNSWGRRVGHDWATELNWTELNVWMEMTEKEESKITHISDWHSDWVVRRTHREEKIYLGRKTRNWASDTWILRYLFDKQMWLLDKSFWCSSLDHREEIKSDVLKTSQLVSQLISKLDLTHLPLEPTWSSSYVMSSLDPFIFFLGDFAPSPGFKIFLYKHNPKFHT